MSARYREFNKFWEGLFLLRLECNFVGTGYIFLADKLDSLWRTPSFFIPRPKRRATQCQNLLLHNAAEEFTTWAIYSNKVQPFRWENIFDWSYTCSMLVSDFTFDYFFSGTRIKNESSFDLTGFNFLIVVNKVSMKYYFILVAYRLKTGNSTKNTNSIERNRIVSMFCWIDWMHLYSLCREKQIVFIYNCYAYLFVYSRVISMYICLLFYWAFLLEAKI